LIDNFSIGIKTLDPNEKEYHPNYHNSEDSDKFYTAHGFNYHNGPEWVWLYGYFIMGLHNFEKKCDFWIARQVNILKNHLK